MAGVFFGMRKRGGITGIRKLTIDSMGISWDEITEKRQQLLESLKDDVEKIFDDLCTERDFSCDGIEFFGRRKSIMCIPTLRTPAATGKMATRTRQKRPLFDNIEEVEEEEEETIRPLKPVNKGANKQHSKKTKSKKRLKRSYSSEIDIVDCENGTPCTLPVLPVEDYSCKTSSVSSDIMIVSSHDSDTCSVTAQSSIDTIPSSCARRDSWTDTQSEMDPAREQEPQIETESVQKLEFQTESQEYKNQNESSSNRKISVKLNETINVLDPVTDTHMLKESQKDGSKTRGQNVSRYSGTVATLDEQDFEAQTEEQEFETQTESKKMSNEMLAVVNEPSPRLIGTTVDNMKSCFVLVRNSPIKAAETKMMRNNKLAEKMAEKSQREDAHKKELEMKKQQERLERIRKREERMKRIAENQAALQKKEKEKLMKVKEGKPAAKDKQKEKEDRILKVKERREAAEQRRLEKEKQRKQKLKEIEEERLLVEELHRKRLQFGEEERQRKKQEKVEFEKERQKRKEEIEKKKIEEKKINSAKQVKAASNKKQIVTVSEQKGETDTVLNQQLNDASDDDGNLSEQTFVIESSGEKIARVRKEMAAMMNRLKQWEDNQAQDDEDSNEPSTVLHQHTSLQYVPSAASCVPSAVPSQNIPPSSQSVPSAVPSQYMPPSSQSVPSAVPSQNMSSTSQNMSSTSQSVPSAVPSQNMSSTSQSVSSAVPSQYIPPCSQSVPSAVPSQNIPSCSVSSQSVSSSSNKPVLSSKYQNISSYNITPQNPLVAADDYGIEDLESDHSTDDEDDPKKAVPMWAAPMNLFKTLKQQESGKMSSVNKIFPPEEVLQSPNLVKIFPKVRKRFFRRTSSAQWTSPMLKK